MRPGDVVGYAPRGAEYGVLQVEVVDTDVQFTEYIDGVRREFDDGVLIRFIGNTVVRPKAVQREHVQ